jgi:hypothetical protein
MAPTSSSATPAIGTQTHSDTLNRCIRFKPPSGIGLSMPVVIVHLGYWPLTRFFPAQAKIRHPGKGNVCTAVAQTWYNA